MCICALLPRIETRTRVILVVHQLEARKPTNTGLIAARCLGNGRVAYRGRRPEGEQRHALCTSPPAHPELHELIPDGSRPLILYPHDGATPIETFRGSAAPLTLIVPDGTWRQAARTRARLAQRFGGEAALPCVTVSPTSSPAVRRRLRTGARPERLATLEALALALGVLEGPAVEASLLHVFRVMTERTLWTNGRVDAAAVTGGIPSGARPHDPLGRGTGGAS